MTNVEDFCAHPRALAATDDGGMVAVVSAGLGAWTLQGQQVIETMTSADYVVRFDGEGAGVWDAGIFGVEATIVDVRAMQIDGDATVIAVRASNGIGNAGVYLGSQVYGGTDEHLSFLARFGPAGSVEDVYIPEGDITIRALAFGPCGDMAFGGEHDAAIDLGSGTIDGSGGFLARRTANGELRWVVPLEGPDSSAAGVVFDAAGRTTWQTFSGDQLALVRLDSAGAREWELGYVDTGYASESGLAGDGLTQLAIGGSYLGGLSVPGLRAVPNDGENHGYLLDLAP